MGTRVLQSQPGGRLPDEENRDSAGITDSARRVRVRGDACRQEGPSLLSPDWSPETGLQHPDRKEEAKLPLLPGDTV